MRLLAMLLLVSLCTAPLLPAAAREPWHGKKFGFVLPLDCRMGEDCYIQNYFNHAAKPDQERLDYACGSLTAFMHFGTDFRLKNEAEMKKGVAVLAAAPGRVSKLRYPADPDAPPFTRFLQKMSGQYSCGTGVRIEHKFGFATHYCHMEEGSVTVAEGDWVQEGQPIGKVGMTGNTAFPHLHFEVWKYGEYIDPFIGHRMQYDCHHPKTSPLWQSDTLAQLAYRPTFVLGGGLAGREPHISGAHQGAFRESLLADDIPLLAFWVEIGGIRAGDRIRQELFAPDGRRIALREESYDRNAAWVLQSVFHRRVEPVGPPTLEEVQRQQATQNEPLADATYPHGRYIARMTLFRVGEAADTGWPYLVAEWWVDIGSGLRPAA